METITLGDTEVSVYAQRHAYLTRRIGPAVQAVIAKGEGVTGESILAYAGEGVYDLLTALIPSMEKRIPRWQFLGFGSQAALDADDYTETDDLSPTIAEIKEAFVVGMRVNGIDELVKLGKVIDPALIRATVNSAVATAVEASMSSATLPSTTGISDSTSSGMTSPAPTENADSPSPAFAA